MSSGTLRTADLESDKPYLWLCGRANTVFPMKSEMLSCLSSKHPHHKPHEPATKLHWPDVSHQSEPGMLNAVHEFGQRKPQVDGHIPEMIWLHQVKETSAAQLRRGLENDDPVRCSRILNIHLSWKLQSITKLSEKEFKRAWWMVINYHRILWLSGVHQYDVSPSNLMVYRALSGLVMGVINDCDLSSPESGSGGHERIGMIPFMAIDLLAEKAIEGKADHLYQHIAESFIWVFLWVCLQYDDETLLSKGRPLDCWLTASGNASDCQKIKCSFVTLAMENRIKVPPPPHSCELDLFLLTFIASYYTEDRDSELDYMFRIWFVAQLPSSIRGILSIRQVA